MYPELPIPGGCLRPERLILGGGIVGVFGKKIRRGSVVQPRLVCHSGVRDGLEWSGYFHHSALMHHVFYSRELGNQW